MAKKTLEDIDVKGKKVFVRADFNVPLDENQNITNDKRIRATLPTIEYLLKQGAAVILASHLGRPKGKVVPEMSTKPVAALLRRRQRSSSRVKCFYWKICASIQKRRKTILALRSSLPTSRMSLSMTLSAVPIVVMPRMKASRNTRRRWLAI